MPKKKKTIEEMYDTCMVTIDFTRPTDFVYFYTLKDCIRTFIKNNDYDIDLDHSDTSYTLFFTNKGGYSSWKGKVSNILKNNCEFSDGRDDHLVCFIASFSDNTTYKIYKQDGKVIRMEIKDFNREELFKAADDKKEKE